MSQGVELKRTIISFSVLAIFGLVSGCGIGAQPTHGSTQSDRAELVLKLDEAILDSDAVVVSRLHEIVYPNYPSVEGAEVWIEILESLKGPVTTGSRVRVSSFEISRDYKNLLFLDKKGDELFVPSGDYRVFSSGRYGRIQTGSLKAMIGEGVLDNWFFLQDVNETTFKFSLATRAETVQSKRSDSERLASEAGELVPIRPPKAYMKAYTQMSTVIVAAREICAKQATP